MKLIFQQVTALVKNPFEAILELQYAKKINRFICMAYFWVKLAKKNVTCCI
jgi:hypothetical protein